MKVRIKFTKTGNLRFIGHLDVMRYFQKAFRRAEVDISYSTGFSPHQIISFAAPLGIGLTSEAEYMDAQFDSTESGEKMLQRINAQMAEGITVTEFKLLPDDAQNAMSSVAAADYLVTPKEEYYHGISFETAIDEFLKKETYVIEKKSKKGMREIDIRPLVYKLHMEDNGIFMQLCTGSTDNCKPNLVLEALCRIMCITYEPFGFQVHRKEIYLCSGSGEQVSYLPLGAVAQNIE